MGTRVFFICSEFSLKNSEMELLRGSAKQGHVLGLWEPQEGEAGLPVGRVEGP